MPALVGVLLSCAALLSESPDPRALQEGICAPDAEACQPPSASANAEPGYSESYATPVEVDCPAVEQTARAGAAEPQFFSFGCNGTGTDLRYRVSRFPESERSAGGLGPQRTRRAARTGSAWTGLPPNQGGLSAPTLPPLAIYAGVILTPPTFACLRGRSDDLAPMRAIEPPDRPPRG